LRLVRNKVDRWLNRIPDLGDKTAAKGGAESQRQAPSSDCSRCKAKHGSTRAGLLDPCGNQLLAAGLACLHLLHHVSNTRKVCLSSAALPDQGWSARCPSPAISQAAAAMITRPDYYLHQQLPRFKKSSVPTRCTY
jgi:hypothetical protein